MDSNMSTAAYVHRAGGSSSGSCTSGSSPVSASANGNGGVGVGGGGGRMAVIGVTRTVKLRRRGNASFGFSLRGGREYAAGFYVSDVVPGGEAHRNGLRVGDQLLRVNGYPIEDAVHQEVALLAKNQPMLILKIRSVGMIPVKDNPNDPVTWHMVQQQQQQLQFGDAVANEIRIRVLVGEKGRLGCGVCRGIVPGLTVQGTREGGPARAAGLKTGDIIVWCNGQSLTDLPFERAIEVMRSAAVLDLVVSRPIVNHVYDCPESLWLRGSSGYDSESSSLVGPSPPPPPPPMTMMSPQRRSPGADPRIVQQSCNRNGRNCCPPNGSDWGHVEQDWMRKPNNTTVIRISQNQQPQQPRRPGPRPPLRGGLYEDAAEFEEEPLYDPVAPKDFECHDFDANPRDEIDRRNEYRREHGIRDYEPAAAEEVFGKENGQPAEGGSVVLGGQRQASEKERKTVTTVEVHQICPPAPPPPLAYKWPSEASPLEPKPMNAMGVQMGSTMSMGSTGSTETESSLESSCGKDTASTSSSLSTSSCEPAGGSVVSFASSIAAAAAKGAGQQQQPPRQSQPKPVPPPPPPPQIDLGTAITQELQRRAKQRSLNNPATQEDKQDKQEPRKPQNPEALRAQEQKVTHDKLMEEFKRAHQRMFNNAQRNQSAEQNAEQRPKPEVVRALPSVEKRPPSSPISSAATLKPRPKANDEAVEMQSIESFKLKDSHAAQTVPKPPSTYFPGGGPRLPAGKSVSKVAIRIGTYESDAKPPARLGFLQQQGQRQLAEPSKLMLHNELAATLQRSNLRKKTEGEPEIPASAEDAAKLQPPAGPDPSGVVSSNQSGSVEKLTGTLNKVTIRVNPEAGGR